VFRKLLAEFGQDRSAYAPDLPGYGESDAPETPPSVAEYAAAVGDMLDTLRLREVDLLGHQTGSLVAAELAVVRPHQVRRVVLAGVPVFDPKEREAYHQRPWPARPGKTVRTSWRNGSASAAGEVPACRWRVSGRCWPPRCRPAMRRPGAGRRGRLPAADRLPMLRQPTLLLRSRDEFWDMTARAEALMGDARRVDLANHDGGLFDAGVADVVRYLREFLDR